MKRFSILVFLSPALLNVEIGNETAFATRLNVMSFQTCFNYILKEMKRWFQRNVSSFFFFAFYCTFSTLFSALSPRLSLCLFFSVSFHFFSCLTRYRKNISVASLFLSLCFGQLNISVVWITAYKRKPKWFGECHTPALRHSATFKIGDHWKLRRAISGISSPLLEVLRFVSSVWSVSASVFFPVCTKNAIKYLLNRCEHSSDCVVCCVQLRRSLRIRSTLSLRVRGSMRPTKTIVAFRFVVGSGI